MIKKITFTPINLTTEFSSYNIKNVIKAISLKKINTNDLSIRFFSSSNFDCTALPSNAKIIKENNDYYLILSNIMANKTINVEFKKRPFYFTVLEGNEFTSSITGRNAVYINDVIQLSVYPKLGYKLTQAKIYSDEYLNNEIAVYDLTKSLDINFTINSEMYSNYYLKIYDDILKYKVTAKADSNSAFNHSLNSTQYVNYGSSIEIMITDSLSDLYELDGLYVNGNKVELSIINDPIYKYRYAISNVYENLDFIIKSKPIQFSIDVVSDEYSSIVPAINVKVNKGEYQVFRFNIPDTREINELMIDGVIVDHSNFIEGYTFVNVRENHSISLTTKPILYTIVATSDRPQARLIPTGNVIVNKGSTQVFTFDLDDTHYIDKVLADGVESTYAKEMNFQQFANIRENHTIHLTSLPYQFNIISTATPYATISPIGTIVVNKRDNRTFTFAVPDTHKVKSIKIDNNEIDNTLTSYTFTDVIAPHTIHLESEWIQHQIKVSKDAVSIVTPSVAATHYVNRRSSITFNFSAPSGYEIAMVFIDGSPQGRISSYTFSNIITDHTVDVYSRIRSLV